MPKDCDRENYGHIHSQVQPSLSLKQVGDPKTDWSGNPRFEEEHMASPLLSQ